jgi:hypothetical protein
MNIQSNDNMEHPKIKFFNIIDQIKNIYIKNKILIIIYFWAQSITLFSLFKKVS